LRSLIRADVPRPERHQVDFDRAQVTVVDLHNLNDRAKRFVVGVVLGQAFERKERSGQARPLQFVVLDELNKYAPREGSSPIKEILLDVAERGRSLGIILVGAQQTASEVERRIVANSAIRVVGRLDSAESTRGEYGFLPPVQRQRATIVKPGTMLVSQPELPIPLVVQFPFPAWATRASEAATGLAGGSPGGGPAGPTGSAEPAGAADGNGHTNGNGHIDGHGTNGSTRPADVDPFAGFPQG
jgi:DNA helicase HerA-like ATPase